jgi:hypothetical protein
MAVCIVSTATVASTLARWIYYAFLPWIKACMVVYEEVCSSDLHACHR